MPDLPPITRFDAHQLEHLDRCPWCGGTISIPLFVERGFPCVQCKACTLIYLSVRVRQDFVGLIYDQPGYHEVSENLPYLRRTGERRLDLLGELKPGTRVVEDGSGNGAFVAACLAQGLDATGCDVGADAVASAQRAFGVELTHGTLESLELPSGSVDVFACFNLLSHLYAPWDYFAEVRRIIRPGGRLLIRTGDRAGLMAWV